MTTGSINLSRSDLEVMYAIAYKQYQHGNYERAAASFELLASFSSDERRFWMGLASSLQMLKEYSKAIDCYSVAAVQNPSDPYAHWHAASCYLATGNKKKGLEVLESAIATAEQHPKYATLLEQCQLVKKAWTCVSQKMSEGA